MLYRILVRTAVRKQAGSMAGIFLMMFLSILCLVTAVTLYSSGRQSVEEEMNRLGFGDFTVWTENAPEELASEIEGLEAVEKAEVQPLIFAGYEIHGKYSDQDGQLLVFDGKVPYHFLSEEGNPMISPTIREGTIYISPALQSSFDIEINDKIEFELSRSHGKKSFVVAGYFEDAFMGSSMIDMKSFLICEADREEMLQMIKESSDGDVLGKEGKMFHIFKNKKSTLTDREFHNLIQTNTSLPLYSKFTYNKNSILDYMLLLQTVFCGFLIAFAIALFLLCLIVTGKSLSDTIEQEKQNIAALKMIGLSGKKQRDIYFIIYGSVLLAGIAAGILLSLIMAELLAKGMLSSTGMLVSIKVPVSIVIFVFIVYILLLSCFLFLKTRNILTIAPVQIIREYFGGTYVHTKMRQRFLTVSIAIRELLAQKRNYAGICIISALLVLFLSMIGRMGTWLGQNGEGLMNAFSVADHDLGVQPFNKTVPMDEIERIITWYSPIKETYELAMESVTVNGLETTANVLNRTEYFHILKGNVCDDNEILITDMIAKELDLAIGDMVSLAGNGRVENYKVSGIYQCANSMGNNIGMSIEGYSKIGNINEFIFCYHYILENGSVRDYAMHYLQDSYQGIDVHTNSWSGLKGIVQLLHGLMVLVYLMAAVVIFITVALSTSKLLLKETKTMAVYKSLGLSSQELRLSFSLRFFLVVFLGSFIGSLAANICADFMIESIFKMFGIGEFISHISMLGTWLPLFLVPVLFFSFAWLFSARLKQVSIVTLISESDDE